MTRFWEELVLYKPLKQTVEQFELLQPQTTLRLIHWVLLPPEQGEEAVKQSCTLLLVEAVQHVRLTVTVL